MAGTPHIGEARLPAQTAAPQGRYVLGELLGRGGMAEVFAGRALGFHGFAKPVAIKRLLPELANDHVFVARLIGEAKLVVGMQHGNIVSVLDLARDGNDVFLVMEYVDGPSLRQLLKARGPELLPLGVAAYIVQAAAAGLDFAHQRSIIHADVSPSNLLLSTSGEVRVADFGIARKQGRSAGVVEGKWAYMAPEQVRDEPLSPGSDVFALGVTLYELLTGEHPIGRRVRAEDRDVPLRVIPPRVRRPDLPVGIDAVCMRALAPDPRDRFARMQELIDALVDERYANGWREGASELAAAIQRVTPAREVPPPSSVTVATRSLLGSSMPAMMPAAPFVASVESTPHARHSLPHGELIAPFPRPATATVPARPSHRTAIAILGGTALLGVVAALAVAGTGDGVSSVPSPRTETQQIPAPTGDAVPSVSSAAAAPAPGTAAPHLAVRVPEQPVVRAPDVDAKPNVKPDKADVKPDAKKERRDSAAKVVRKPAADAKLIVRTEGNWAFVFVGGQRAETPPQASFKLAAGTYRVVAKNSDEGIVVRCTVTLAAGETKRLEVAMEEGQCSE